MGHARPVCTGTSWTAGLRGPRPGPWETHHQTVARPATVASAAARTIAMTTRSLRGVTGMEDRTGLRPFARRSLRQRDEPDRRAGHALETEGQREQQERRRSEGCQVRHVLDDRHVRLEEGVVRRARRFDRTIEV